MAGDEIRVERHHDDMRLVVVGALDYRAVDLLTDATFDDLRTDGAIVVDLTGLEFIDSTGLSMLLRLRHLASEVHLAGAPPVATSLLRMTGVESMFVFDSPMPADA